MIHYSILIKKNNYMFLNSIDYEITFYDEISFKIKFKILFNKLIIIILKTNIFNKVNILINP
jgi:hypothetical protein